MQNLTLGSIDIKKIITGLLIAEGGAILTTMAVWFQAGKFDFKELLLLEEAVIISTLINTLRKIFDGEVNK